MTGSVTNGPPRPPAVLVKADALLDLLAAVAETHPAEAADRLGEPRSSMYRLLDSMQAIGWVEPGPGRTYQLGRKLLQLGASARRQQEVWSYAVPVMEQLHEATGETVFLCVRRRWEAVCIERIDGIGVQSQLLQVGHSLPLHAGAAARALLAFEPPEVWEQYLASGPLVRYTPSTPIDADALIASLHRARSLGVAVSDGDVTPGIGAVGAPVFDRAGRVAGAISLSGLRAAILGDGAPSDALAAAAQDVSAALAGRPTPEPSHQAGSGDGRLREPRVTGVSPETSDA